MFDWFYIYFLHSDERKQPSDGEHLSSAGLKTRDIGVAKCKGFFVPCRVNSECCWRNCVGFCTYPDQFTQKASEIDRKKCSKTHEGCQVNPDCCSKRCRKNPYPGAGGIVHPAICVPQTGKPWANWKMSWQLDNLRLYNSLRWMPPFLWQRYIFLSVRCIIFAKKLHFEISCYICLNDILVFK